MRTHLDNQAVINAIFKKIRFTPVGETVFFADLPIAGMDAETLMTELADEFNFKLDTFDVDKYIISEYDLGASISHLLFNREKLTKATFTFTHLLEVINKGEWFDPA